METKPYSLQSPEQIAKDYGGNKQRIAEAMQLGIIDPTAGTMAAMFIDRMRAAQQQETAPQQTVAQQVFAPPPPPMGAMPPAGLGATPQAAAMPPIPGGAPMTASPAPPMGAPGMAAGGLTTLPLPDDMFNEPDAGGYAAGGIVAFAAGDPVRDPNAPPRNTDSTAPEDPANQDIEVTGQRYNPSFVQARRVVLPNELGGFFDNLIDNLAMRREVAPRETEEARQYREYLRSTLDPEERKRRRQEDMWMTLGQIGARMASTPGSLLQAASTGIAEALPGVRTSASERRGEQRAARQALVAEERLANREVSEEADRAVQMLQNFNSLAEALSSQTFNDRWQQLSSADRRYVADVAAAANITTQGMAGEAQRDVARIGSAAEDRRFNFQVNQMVREMIGPNGDYRAAYLQTPDSEKRAFVTNLRRMLGATDGFEGFSATPVR